MSHIDIEEYARIAPQYYNQKIPHLLKDYLQKSNYKSLLDCGCGDGSLMSALMNKGFLKNKDAFALDRSKNRIELLKKLGDEIKSFVDDCETMESVGDCSIDFLISTQVIEHVDQEKMLKNIERVVNNGGHIYLTTVFKKWYGWYFYRNNGRWVIDPTHVREYKADEDLFNLIDRKKFEVLENKKSLMLFPIVDFFIKRFGIKDRDIFRNKFLGIVRSIKIPIPGYYTWEIILMKK